MRACNGCRKRKIKCDAATTNTWPCSACTRLKLVCVPPTIAQDGDFLATGQALGQESHNVGTSHSVDASRQNLPMQQNLGSNSPNQVGGIAPYNSALGIYSQYVPSQNQHSIYSEVHPQLTMPHPYHQQAVYPTTPSRPLANAESGVFLDPEQSTAEGLSEALGELKIDETGIGEFLKHNIGLV